MSTGIGVGIAGQVYDLKPGVPGGGGPTPFSNLYSTNFIPASNQFLQLSSTPLLGTSGTGAWTVSVWIYMNNIPTTNRRICDINSGGSSTPADRFVLFYKASTNLLNVSGAWTDNSAFPIAATTWYNVIYSYDGNAATAANARFVINGTNIDTKSNATWNQNNITGTSFIGKNAVGGYWDGVLDEFSIWDKYLTDAECIELYNSGTPTDLTASSMTGNLQHWWRMGDPTGPATYPTIVDAKGSINATMTAMTSANIITNVP